MKPQPHFKLTTIIVLLVFLVGIVATSAIEIQEVEAKKVIKKSVEKLKKIKTIGKNAPTLVKMNKTHIYIKGAKCSCGKQGHYYRDKTTNKFKNQCPFCKKYNTLVYNKKRVTEGELTCKKCDFDACCFEGNDKSGRFRKTIKRWK
ncbi:MAG: hypothetical protein LBM02_08065 [Lachnospiraceae bacterium]|jgi:hypothetical protein|nr:hypothetical protein [Lachnospiraceae bacterium]